MLLVHNNNAALLCACTSLPRLPPGKTTIITGAIDGRKKLCLKMNLARDKLGAVVRQLPAEQSPTISTLLDDRYVAVEVVVDERIARDLVTFCKRLGATGIVTSPVSLIIH